MIDSLRLLGVLPHGDRVAAHYCTGRVAQGDPTDRRRPQRAIRPGLTTAQPAARCSSEKGRIEPVSLAVCAYEVSGMPIVRKWFNYRSPRPRSHCGSPLDDIRPNRALQTTAEPPDLLNMLALCVAMDPRFLATTPHPSRLFTDCVGPSGTTLGVRVGRQQVDDAARS